MMQIPADTLSFRLASQVDVAAVVALVNSAYRGDSSRQGWTTEADLLDGTRTDSEEVAGFISDPHSLVLLCEQHGQLLGTAHLAHHGDHVHLGMFTVRPGSQGRGIGKVFLAAAEQMARQHFGAQRMAMQVITRREELIAFYHRRGYQCTGQHSDFPSEARYGIPRVDLQLELLVKTLGD